MGNAKGPGMCPIIWQNLKRFQARDEQTTAIKIQRTIAPNIVAALRQQIYQLGEMLQLCATSADIKVIEGRHWFPSLKLK